MNSKDDQAGSHCSFRDRDEPLNDLNFLPHFAWLISTGKGSETPFSKYQNRPSISGTLVNLSTPVFLGYTIGVTQSSTLKPGTRSNSRRLLVTTIRP